jgi:hypothetical protein
MSNSRTSMHSNRVQKIVFTDDRMDCHTVMANARKHERVFCKVLRRMGLEQSFPIELASGHGFTNIAVSVLDGQQTGSGPRLLIPVDPQSLPDERAIEVSLARSIGLMLASAEMYDQIWVDTYGDILALFSNRPEASFQCLDFVAGPHDWLLLHGEFLRLDHNFSTTRSRRIASDIQELIEAIDFDLREHDRNVAALTVDELGSYRTKITGLAVHVLELAGISSDELSFLFDENGDHPFNSVDGSLPFCAGRFYWSKGTLECSLEMRKGRSWIDGPRVILSHPSNLPATTLSSCVGRPLNALLQIEGLEFEATIKKVHAERDWLVIEIELPTKEFAKKID